MTDTTTGNKTTPDGRSYYETLTPDALRYNGLAKCFYVDDLYTMDIDQAKALQRRLKELIVTAEVDPDECSDDPRNGYLAQGRRQLNLDEVRVLNGHLALGSAYTLTTTEVNSLIYHLNSMMPWAKCFTINELTLKLKEEIANVRLDDFDPEIEAYLMDLVGTMDSKGILSHIRSKIGHTIEAEGLILTTLHEILGKRIDYYPVYIQAKLRDLYFALGTMFANNYGVYLLRHINPLIHALEGNALAFLPTEVQPALLELRALLTDGDASAEEGSADQDEDMLGQWQLTITARRSGLACKGRDTIEIAPKNRDHKSAVYMRIMVQAVCDALNSKSQSMVDLIGGYRHEGCDDPNCPICSKYNRD